MAENRTIRVLAETHRLAMILADEQRRDCIDVVGDAVAHYLATGSPIHDPRGSVHGAARVYRDDLPTLGAAVEVAAAPP